MTLCFLSLVRGQPIAADGIVAEFAATVAKPCVSSPDLNLDKLLWTGFYAEAVRQITISRVALWTPERRCGVFQPSK